MVRAYGRPLEAEPLALTRCDGTPNLDALDALSILARPHGLDRPTRSEVRRFARHAPAKRRHRFVAPGILRLAPGLLRRVQAIADHWPHDRIEIVSGYRPHERHESRHFHGRALDIRVTNVPRHRVSQFARTLTDTGVGYYPNSSFTHVDVRDQSAYWVNRSGPGEPADYGMWPPRPEEARKAREQALASALRAMSQLRIDAPEDDARALDRTAALQLDAASKR